MGITNVMQTGRSGMMAAQAGISTAGHNITNANTEGFSRQRVETEATTPNSVRGEKIQIGTGTSISRVSRINDEYLDKQIRNANKNKSGFEEKEMALRQAEDIFNEMGGEGINRLMAKFFNNFRQLANDPSSEAIRQSVRESARSMVSDFRRLRLEVDETRKHIDSRIEGYSKEVNALAKEIRDLNLKIKVAEIGGGSPNDLLDKRDQALKKMGEYMDLSMHKDKDGSFYVDIKGVGPLIAGPSVEEFYVFRSGADDQGKAENALDLGTTASASSVVTHRVKGGKIGSLLEVRDHTLSTIQARLDELAFRVSEAVNEIHRQGFTRNGVQGMDFFKTPPQIERAAEYLDLSDAVKADVNTIATAAQPDAPGDNRVAIAISGLQNMRLMNDGAATVDDFYNSIISEIGVAAASNKNSLNQSNDIVTQLNKMRETISGVSIDEETMNLMQFKQAFDASAKVIQVADEMLDTVLSIKR